MKIEKIRTMAVGIPIDKAPYSTEGEGTKRYWNRLFKNGPNAPLLLEYVLAFIHCDDGTVGVGEAQADMCFFGTTPAGVRDTIDQFLAPHFIGEDPRRIGPLMDRVDYRENGAAKSAMEMALLDCVGKNLGLPVYTLLGGDFRKHVPLAFEIAGGAPEKMAGFCRELQEKGVRAFKLKLGGYPQRDYECVRAVRETTGPEVSLRVDANRGFDVKEAIRFCRLCEAADLGVEILEQPVDYRDLPGMREIKRATSIPIEADESCYSIEDAALIIRMQAADVINVKLGKCGGLRRGMQMATMAEASGLRTVLGTAFGLGVELTAKLHLAAALPRFDGAVEATEMILHPNFLLPPHKTDFTLPLKDGGLPVPDGPGLGISVDEEALSPYLLP